MTTKLENVLLSGMAIAALARVYASHEARRTPLSIWELVRVARWDDEYGEVSASRAIGDLFHNGLIELSGVLGMGRSGDRRQVRITDRGMRWFELNCDYRRECNVWRYHTRFGTAGIFEWDPRRSLTRRILDPLVFTAAVSGAVTASLICWLP